MLAHLGDHAQPVHLGQHAVDDCHVIRPRQRQRQSDIAVGGIVHHMSGFLQPLDQITLGFQIVLDHENTHAVKLLCVNGVRAGGVGGGTRRHRRGGPGGEALRPAA